MSAPVPRWDAGNGDHEQWDALAVGWAMSALESHDEALFAVHLPGCERCTETVQETLRTVADLAYALPDEVPPPSLRARIMQAVALEPRRPPEPRARPDEHAAEVTSVEGEWPLGAGAEPYGPAGRGASGSPEWIGSTPGTPAGSAPRAVGREDRTDSGQDSPPGVVGPRRPPDGGRHSATDDRAAGPGQPPAVVPLQPRRRRWAAAVAAAAAVVLIAALGAWNVRLRSEQDELRRMVAQRDAAIAVLTANAPARIAALTADGKPSPTRRATVVVRGNQVEIITETLGATGRDVTYWLWTLKCDLTDLKPISGFKVARPEFSVRSIGSDPAVAATPCFAVSEELGTATPATPRKVVAVGAAK